MTRFIIDAAAFRALVRGQALAAGEHQVIMSPRLGWLDQVQAAVDAARGGQPPAEQLSLRAAPEQPKDPPEAREFLPNRYTRRPE